MHDSTKTAPEKFPTDPIITRFDDLGRVVQVIEPAGKPLTISFYGFGCWKQSSDKKGVADGFDPPAG